MLLNNCACRTSDNQNEYLLYINCNMIGRDIAGVNPALFSSKILKHKYDIEAYVALRIVGHEQQ